MTPEEKANELTNKYFDWYGDEFYFSYKLAKEVATMCVDEILKAREAGTTGVVLDKEYWEEVKDYINLL